VLRPTLPSDRIAFFAVFACSIVMAVAPSGHGSADRRRASSLDPPPVSRVERANLERIVAKLSGADTVTFADESIKINTRYASSPLMARVREYLVREIRAAGYEPEFRRFVLQIEVPDLTGSTISRGRDTLWVAGVDGTVYRRAIGSGGPGFERVSVIPQIVFDLEHDARGRLLSGGRVPGSAGGSIYRSADGGLTWNLLVSGGQTYTIGTITVEDELFGMAGGSGGTVIYTADGGDSWVQRDPAGVGHEALNGSATNAPLQFWFVSDAGNLYETRDLGASFTKRSLAWGRLAAIDFWGERAGVIVGSQRIFYTRDAGETWTPVSIPAELTAVAMVDSLRVVAAGGAGEAWISEDGGASWERFGAECGVVEDVWSVVSAGRDTLWLAGRDVVRRIVDDGGARSCEAYAFADTVWSKNIVFRREGVNDPARRVVLCAHYDSYSGSTPLICAPGADDNATGTAAVIECARVLRSERLERTVEFILFDAEELGLKGSRTFAAALDPGAVYECALNLDMIGWEPNAVMTAVISGRAGEPGDSAIAFALAAAIDSFDIPLVVEYLTGERLSSDHAAFWEVGVPAVLLIEGRRSELTPHYHSCSDGATTINYAFHEVCTKAALGAISSLAGLLQPEVPPPAALALRQNYPNPFNMGTIIRYELPEASAVEIEVFDAAGRRVAVVDRGRKEAGENVCRWDGRDHGGRLVQSGVYFLRLRAASGEAVRKMVVVR
jgi:hypothetical protein